MRKIALLLALPTAWLACFSNDNGSPDGGSPEFDSGGSSDASLDSPQLLDVGTTFLDSASDAMAPIDVGVDAPPPVLTVIVGGAAGYEQNVAVVWSDATGSVVGMSMTDANGSATTGLATVAMATAVLGTVGSPSPYTVMGVRLGETIVVADVLGFRQSFEELTASITSVATTPTLDDGGPVNDEIHAGPGCLTGAGGSPPFNLPIYSNCVGLAPMGASFGAAVSVVEEADDSSGNPLGYAYSNGHAIGALDGGALDIALPGTWMTTFGAQTIVVGDTDAGGAPTLAYSEVASGALVPLTLHGITPDAAVSVADTAYTHLGFAQQVQAEAYFRGGDETIGGTLLETIAPAPTGNGTVTIDPTPLASAPTFATSSVDFTTPSQPVISWTLGGGTSLSSSTAAVAIVSWYDQLDGGQNQNGTWTIVSPGTTATSLTPPALPPSLAMYAPGTGAGEGSLTLFAVNGQTAFPTYASFLLAASVLQADSNVCDVQSPALPALGAFGTVMVTIYSDGEGC
jgi:hypothetical protein